MSSESGHPYGPLMDVILQCRADYPELYELTIEQPDRDDDPVITAAAATSTWTSQKVDRYKAQVDRMVELVEDVPPLGMNSLWSSLYRRLMQSLPQIRIEEVVERQARGGTLTPAESLAFHMWGWRQLEKSRGAFPVCMSGLSMQLVAQQRLQQEGFGMLAAALDRWVSSQVRVWARVAHGWLDMMRPPTAAAI